VLHFSNTYQAQAGQIISLVFDSVSRHFRIFSFGQKKTFPRNSMICLRIIRIIYTLSYANLSHIANKIC